MLPFLKSFFQRPAIQWIGKAVLAIVALGYLVYIVDPSEILTTLQDARWVWVLAAMMLLPLNLGLEALVWRQMLKPVAREVSLRATVEGLFCGFSLGVFTPARVGEFAGRAFYIRHPDRWETTVTVLMQRFIDMAVAVGLGTAALGAVLLYTEWLNPMPWMVLMTLSAGITSGLFLMLFFPRSVLWFLHRWISSATIIKRLRLLKRIARPEMAVAVSLATARYVIYITQFAFLALAFAIDLALVAVFGAIMLVFLAKFLAPSITLMDLGIREGFAVFFFGVAGLSQAAAFNASLFVFLLNVALPAVVGIPYLLQMRFATTKDSSVPARSAN